MTFETIRKSQQGAVLFPEFATPPVNLLGPELVRDLVSLESVRPGQLRRDSTIADRFRAFRARERRLYRRSPAARGEI
jgi:hypothetical protein